MKRRRWKGVPLIIPSNLCCSFFCIHYLCPWKSNEDFWHKNTGCSFLSQAYICIFGCVCSFVLILRLHPYFEQWLYHVCERLRLAQLLYGFLSLWCR
ncbi:hypothetical protein L6452_40737 [Arctium lappa]|uniref:Uncharacterized protein n=1 Tax=Arctium lappa TaxID=4217 RepID=A0ACB8XNL2_ARCLA|nr:hypothetical protein L6452_40737 [Arctium lappa]